MTFVTLIRVVNADDGPCPPVLTPQMQTGVAVPDVFYRPPDFQQASPTARPIPGAILNGAVYDSLGQILCVLPPSLPGAYVASKNFVAGQVPQSICASLTARLQAGDSSGLTQLRLSNSELLRRLIWLTGEGGCHPVRTFCPGAGAAGCRPGAPQEYGSRYFGYVLKNLRNSTFVRTGAPKFASDDEAMAMACNAGQDVDATPSEARYIPGAPYNNYFVRFQSNAHIIGPVVLQPSTWGSNPAPNPPLENCTILREEARETCFAKPKVSRCLADVIAAELDVNDEHSPFRNADGTPDRLRVRWTSGMPHLRAGDPMPHINRSPIGHCGTGRVRIELEREDSNNPARSANAHCFGLPLDHPQTHSR